MLAVGGAAQRARLMLAAAACSADVVSGPLLLLIFVQGYSDIFFSLLWRDLHARLSLFLLAVVVLLSKWGRQCCGVDAGVGDRGLRRLSTERVLPGESGYLRPVASGRSESNWFLCCHLLELWGTCSYRAVSVQYAPFRLVRRSRRHSARGARTTCRRGCWRGG